MSKISLAAVSVLVLIAIAFAWSEAPRAQGSTQFEYVRAYPYKARQEIANRDGSRGVVERTAYRACRAAGSEWSCRDYPTPGAADAALRTMLATMGNEGWELVSAVDEGEQYDGLTYLFKRPVR